MSLYSIVEEYASLGDHRTGTQVDHDTTDWFCDRLERVGARVETSGFAVGIYRAEWRLVIDDEKVPSIPLFYEGVGSVRTSAVSRAVLEVQSYDAVFRDLPGIIEAARKTPNEALVVSTVCPNNSIYAINRKPELASGLPTLLVPGLLSGQLANAHIELELDARIEAGQSRNTIGHFGNTNQPPIVVTTPLSGWFSCAGERGTGIAVALSVAQSLGELAPVMLVATSDTSSTTKGPGTTQELWSSYRSWWSMSARAWRLVSTRLVTGWRSLHRHSSFALTWRAIVTSKSAMSFRVWG